MRIIKPGIFNYAWTDSQREQFDNENFDYLKLGKETDIIFYGDSITACWNMDDYFSKEIKVLNRAIGGDRTRYMLYRFDADCIQLHPKKVVFLGGINDIRAWSKKEDYFAHMNEINIVEEVVYNIFSMARKCEANNIEFIISSILPIDEDNIDNDLINGKIKIINEILKKFCIEKKFVFINYYNELLMKDSNGLDKTKTVDGLHPNEEGYTIMKEVLLKHIGGENNA